MYNFIQCVFSCDKKTLNTQAYNSLKVFLQKWARLLESKILMLTMSHKGPISYC